MDYVMTFLEGLASFISPCILPLLPVYLIYFAGGAADKRRTLTGACAFVSGFSLVFVLLGVFAGTLGALLGAHRHVISYVCGGIVVALGLSYLGLFRLPGGRNAARKSPTAGFLGSFLFGMVYAVSLTPCVGVFLGAALALAARSASVGKGAALLAVYALGLAVPFVLSALFIDRLKGVFMVIKNHYKVINPVCGALLVLFGAGLIVQTACATGAKVPAEAPKTAAEKEASVARPRNVSAAAFEKEVLGAELPVIVDFWAPWCGPCRQMAPVLDELAAKSAGKFRVVKVNIDEAPELASRYQVNAIPNIVLFEKGQVRGRSVGLCTAAELRGRLRLP